MRDQSSGVAPYRLPVRGNFNFESSVVDPYERPYNRLIDDLQEWKPILPQERRHDLATTVDTLILDLLDWIGPEERPYAEVIEAWRTSCPRLPVWEEANERGYVERRYDIRRGAFIAISARGREFIRASRTLDRAPRLDPS